MPTVDKTWVFLADNEGLVDVGDSATLASNWSAADGNPLGDLEWQASTGGAQTTTERARRAATGQTWQTWGVPAGSIVTSVQVVSWDYLLWAASSVSAFRNRWRIVNSSGTTVHSAGELVDDAVNHVPDGGTPHAGAAGTSRNVDSSFQASTTDVRFEQEVGFTSGGTPSVDYENDNVLLRITYQAGGPSWPFQPLPVLAGP